LHQVLSPINFCFIAHMADEWLALVRMFFLIASAVLFQRHSSSADQDKFCECAVFPLRHR